MASAAFSILDRLARITDDAGMTSTCQICKSTVPFGAKHCGFYATDPQKVEKSTDEECKANFSSDFFKMLNATVPNTEAGVNDAFEGKNETFNRAVRITQARMDMLDKDVSDKKTSDDTVVVPAPDVDDD